MTSLNRELYVLDNYWIDSMKDGPGACYKRKNQELDRVLAGKNDAIICHCNGTLDAVQQCQIRASKELNEILNLKKPENGFETMFCAKVNCSNTAVNRILDHFKK